MNQEVEVHSTPDLDAAKEVAQDLLMIYKFVWITETKTTRVDW